MEGWARARDGGWGGGRGGRVVSQCINPALMLRTNRFSGVSVQAAKDFVLSRSVRQRFGHTLGVEFEKANSEAKLLVRVPSTNRQHLPKVRR